MTPTERVKAGLSALPDSYRGTQPGGLGSKQMQKYMPTRGEIRDINEKYQRGADIQRYVDKSAMYQTALEQGAKTFSPDGIERVNLAGTGFKDPKTGATMLSMMKPSLTATAPTFGQLVGDIGRGLGSMLQGGADFLTSGGITGALFRGAKDLFTNPTGTAKNMYYGAQDMMKGYNPLTKSTVAPTPEIKAEPLPGLDLEAKMSAYSDPSAYYASLQEQKPKGDYLPKQDQNYYQGKPSQSPTGNQYLYADAGDAAQNYMQLLKNVQNLGNTPYGNFGVKDILSNPTLTYEKEIGPGTLSGKIGDNQASLGYSMIFNKGGRVRGTGIMGAL